MHAPTTTGEIDLVTDAVLAELAHARGPGLVSLAMPTHRAGPDTRQDPIRFRNLLGRAAELLGEHSGITGREADELLAPARALLAGGAVYTGDAVPSGDGAPVAARFRW